MKAHKQAKTLKQNPSLRARMFRVLALLAIASAVVVLVVTSWVYQKSLVSHTQSMLEIEIHVLAEELGNNADSSELDILESHDFGELRVTLIASDGTVLYDSYELATSMANHLDRPEVQEALSDGVGESVRSSSTIDQVSVYRAELLESGNILRLSIDRDGVGNLLLEDVRVVAFIVCALVALSWIVARVLSSRIMDPIMHIDPKHPGSARDEAYLELLPLVDRLEVQQERLQAQMRKLQGVSEMRQEFTANITHERKTPIAAISAAAEMIREGIARPEDIPDFANRIYTESSRLSELVSDILTLSKLDEVERRGGHSFIGQIEPCDLMVVCHDVVRRHSSQAHKAKVELVVEGTSARVMGHPKLLDELVNNLCDNAIRYNEEGGSVHVRTGLRDGRPFVEISDTGCGIAPDEQKKVFERFYRVDPSRSRNLGGTGLGLAIVKHAATFHRAHIDMESTEGEGTTITVYFPAAKDLYAENTSLPAADDGLNAED